MRQVDDKTQKINALGGEKYGGETKRGEEGAPG